MSGMSAQELLSGNSVRILGYVASNPGCKKSDILHCLSRTTRTRDRLNALRDAGLINFVEGERSNWHYCYVTERGRRVLDLVAEIDAVLVNSDIGVDAQASESQTDVQ